MLSAQLYDVLNFLVFSNLYEVCLPVGCPLYCLMSAYLYDFSYPMCAQLCDVCPPIWCLLKRDVGLPLQYNVCSTEIAKIPCPLSSNLLPIPPPPVTNPTHSSPLWFQMQFSIFFCFEKQGKYSGTIVRFPFSHLAKCEKHKKILIPPSFACFCFEKRNEA